MNKEEKFLNIIKSTLKDATFIGDDCAYIEEFNLTISQDTLIEDVHFSLEYMTPYEIGQKALLVNISDILASGARPYGATISLSGKLDEGFISEFYKGIEEVAKEHNLKILGGDLTGGDKIAVSISILGNAKKRKISSRKNAKTGYIVAIKGIFGRSHLGFLELTKGENGNFSKYHKKPELYPKTARMISENCKEEYALMDSSDGLFDCLKKITKESKAGASIGYNLIPKATNDFNTTLFGGEDFALVGAFSKDDFEKLQNLGAELTKIGEIIEKEGVFVDNEEILEDKSYEHF